MSEQNKPTGFMQELDKWVENTVIDPLLAHWPADYEPHPMSEGEIEDTVEKIKKAIREKVLESYRNGKAAQAPRAYKRTSYAKR
jgi:hypothetical protein